MNINYAIDGREILLEESKKGTLPVYHDKAIAFLKNYKIGLNKEVDNSLSEFGYSMELIGCEMPIRVRIEEGISKLERSLRKNAQKTSPRMLWF